MAVDNPIGDGAVVSLTGVCHRYRAVTAVDDATFAIAAGGTAGIIGPDGVGKSTLLAIMAGVRRIQQGDVFVLGGDMRRRNHRRSCISRIAYMPQGLGRNLYPTLSVSENLVYFAKLFGLVADERREHIAELLRSTGLDPFSDRPAGKLSGGMKQKLALCCALIHDPDLLILDEPTTGVDPLSRRQFWDLIDRMRQRRPQMSVIAATAYMEEAERFDWLAAMDAGRVIATGSPASIKNATRSPTLEEAFVSLLPEARRHGRSRVHIPPRPLGDGPPAIEAEGLTKTFGTFTAVDHVNLRIEKGEIFGFLGSNGCGKSTTMRMLTGLLPADAGQALLLGQALNAGGTAVRRRIGYMSQSFSLYGELSVRQNLDLHAGIFELPKHTREARIAEMLQQFGLAKVKDSLPESLPLGVRQRLQLAVAVLHRPEVLILDEPTSGVDPVARDEFWEYLIGLSRQQGITIFLSTHFMNEAERCDRISLMHAGKILAVGAPQELVEARKVASLEDAFIAYLEDAAGAKNAPAAQQAAGPGAIAAASRQRLPHRAFDMRRLLACAWRESIEVLRDPIRMAFALAGPLLLLIAIGFGMSFDVEALPFAALDQDRTGGSREFLAAFEGSRYFRRMPAIASSDQLDNRMRTGELALAIEIPAGFGKDLRAGRVTEAGIWIDGAMPFRAETARSYVAGVVNSYHLEKAARAADPSSSPPPADIGTRFRYNQEFRSSSAIVPGAVMLMLMLIPAMMMAVGVVREKETGAIANFRSTPVSQLEYLVGKQLPYVAISSASFLLLLSAGDLIFAVPAKGALPVLAAGALLFILASTGFGLVISSFTRTQIAAIFATPIVAMVPSINFSGMLTPVSSLSPAARAYGLAFPSAWFQEISVGVFAKGLGIVELWPDFAVLALFAATYIAAASALLQKQEA